MNDIFEEIRQYRTGICKAFLITLSLIAFPALFATLSRVYTIGWQPVMLLHIFIAVSLWFLTLFRNRAPYSLLAGYIVFMFLAIGLGGLLQFGLVAGGVVFLALSSPIATLLFGGRIGSAILIFGFACASVIAILIINGTLQLTFNVNQYVIASTSWLTSIIGWLLATVALTVSLNVFNSKLINALKLSRHHEQELSDQQNILQQTLQEKEKLLREVKQLQGIIPICSYCRRIRSDEGAWGQLEDYVSKHSDTKFSHGICPSCLPHAMKEAGIDDSDT